VARMVGAPCLSEASTARSQLAKGYGRQALVGLSCLRSTMTLRARTTSFVGSTKAYDQDTTEDCCAKDTDAF
jgi:hypothetical protein